MYTSEFFPILKNMHVHTNTQDTKKIYKNIIKKIQGRKK